MRQPLVEFGPTVDGNGLTADPSDRLHVVRFRDGSGGFHLWILAKLRTIEVEPRQDGRKRDSPLTIDRSSSLDSLPNETYPIRPPGP